MKRYVWHCVFGVYHVRMTIEHRTTGKNQSNDVWRQMQRGSWWKRLAKARWERVE